jgi:hypothetical protein
MKAALLAALAFVALVLSVPGCRQESRIIERVTVTPADNLESVRVALVFSSRIQPELSAGFVVKQYGYLFVNPFTSTTPFELGFDLHTSIFSDAGFAQLTPTTVYPNGMPIGLDYALVQIQPQKPVSDRFDIYGYVDVLHARWLGAAAIFNFMNDGNFPAGTAFTQVFKRDQSAKPLLVGSVFGPTLGPDGSLRQNGGIMLLADVRGLLDGARAGFPESFKAEPGAAMNEELLSRFSRDPRSVRKIEEKIIRELNQL